jgi:hypothetical protein
MPVIRHKKQRKFAPLTPEEIHQYQQLPALNLVQIARMLQKTTAQVHEMSRKRAIRPLPVFKSGREIFSTWTRIQAWIDEGFEYRKAA